MATCSAPLRNTQWSDFQCLELRYEKYRKMCWVSAPDHGTLRAWLNLNRIAQKICSLLRVEASEVWHLGVSRAAYLSYLGWKEHYSELQIWQYDWESSWILINSEAAHGQGASTDLTASTQHPFELTRFNPPKWTSTIHQLSESQLVCLLKKLLCPFDLSGLKNLSTAPGLKGLAQSGDFLCGSETTCARSDESL